MDLKHAIVLTGGIATGKSTTSAILSLLGFRVIDADKIAHQVLNMVSDEIAKAFGDEFVNSGIVDRKKLGALIFANRDERLKLEAIVHPKIREEIFNEALKQEKFAKPYLIDIPLFFEKRDAYNIDKSILVYAPKELQIERLTKREGLSKDEALQRIEAQMPIEKKLSLATFVIDNSKDLKHLQKECERVKEEILCM